MVSCTPRECKGILLSMENSRWSWRYSDVADETAETMSQIWKGGNLNNLASTSQGCRHPVLGETGGNAQLQRV